MSNFGALASGLIQGMAQQKMQKSQQQEAAEARKLEDTLTKLKIQEAKNKQSLLNMLMPMMQQQQPEAKPEGYGQPSRGPEGLGDGTGGPKFAESFGQQGGGLAEAMSTQQMQFDPMMAQIMKAFTGVDVPAAQRDMQPEKQDLSEAALIQRALQGDPEATAMLERWDELKRNRAAAGGSTVNIKNMGTIPPGYRVQYDQSGNPVGMTPIPGGPAEREILEGEAQKEKAAEITGTAAQTVWEDGVRSMSVITENPKQATGLMGKVSKRIPGTPAHELNQHFESMRGNIAVDSLLKIKASGAGLGQVPQSQLEMLAGLLGRLDVEMETQELKFNLNRIMEIYADIVEKTGGDPEGVFKKRLEKFGQPGKKPQSMGAPGKVFHQMPGKSDPLGIRQ